MDIDMHKKLGNMLSKLSAENRLIISVIVVKGASGYDVNIILDDGEEVSLDKAEANIEKAIKLSKSAFNEIKRQGMLTPFKKIKGTNGFSVRESFPLQSEQELAGILGIRVKRSGMSSAITYAYWIVMAAHKVKAGAEAVSDLANVVIPSDNISKLRETFQKHVFNAYLQAVSKHVARAAGLGREGLDAFTPMKWLYAMRNNPDDPAVKSLYQLFGSLAPHLDKILGVDKAALMATTTDNLLKSTKCTTIQEYIERALSDDLENKDLSTIDRAEIVTGLMTIAAESDELSPYIKSGSLRQVNELLGLRNSGGSTQGADNRVDIEQASNQVLIGLSGSPGVAALDRWIAENNEEVLASPVRTKGKGYSRITDEQEIRALSKPVQARPDNAHQSENEQHAGPTRK